MRSLVLTFRGSRAEFLDYLDDLALDASVARHPAGKGLGCVTGCTHASGPGHYGACVKRPAP